MIQRVKGTQDFLDLTLYNFIIDTAQRQLSLYGFHEIATPILEPSELFMRSLGQETDVVSKEMFFVSSGPERTERICLRPEATASTVRAFIEHHITQLPWKVFSHGSMFRHERPQKGRFREFHQLSFEVIGADSVAQDADLLVMLDRFFQEKLLLESCALIINYLGCAQDRLRFKEKLYGFLQTVQEHLCSTCLIRKEKNILRVFDCKESPCQHQYQSAPKITDHLCSSCSAEWRDLQSLLELLSVPFSHVPSLVRGLDYYDKTVFEFVSHELGAQNTFCAGGRYNSLVELLGGQSQPAIGAAMGIERLLLMLDPIKERLPLAQLPALSVLMPMSAEQVPLVLLVADQLRAHNIVAEVVFEGSLKSMMRHANKRGARFALIIGPDEQERQEVTIKKMLTGEQQRLKQTELANYLTLGL